jgi:hypothetical protein
MSPTARKVARLTGELESVATRLKNLLPELQSLDLDSQALQTAKQPREELVIRVQTASEIKRIISRYTETEIPKSEVLEMLDIIINGKSLF